MNNYRSISIIVAKVYNRIIYDQAFAYVTEHNLISSHQSGFRHLHSTVTALLEATDNWVFNIDSGNVNAVVFLDLKKPFDTVDHDVLLSKLNVYGIRGAENNWLFLSPGTNYLKHSFGYSGAVAWNSLPVDLMAD